MTKRKRDDDDQGDQELEDSFDELVDDEPSKFGAQVLPVAELPDNFNGVPEDGASYLFMVRRSASTLPLYTRVDNPFTLPPAPPPQEARIERPGHPSIPSNEWRSAFETRFMHLRKVLLSDEVTLRSSGAPTLPKTKDRDGWWKFINGDLKISHMLFTGRFSKEKDQQDLDHEKETLEIQDLIPAALEDPSLVDDDDDTDDEEDEEMLINSELIMIHKTGIVEADTTLVLAPLPHSGVEQDKGKRKAQAIPGDIVNKSLIPSISIIKRLDHKATYHVLMFFTFWIQKCIADADEYVPRPILSLRESDSQWIFSLLAHMDNALTSDEISTLRLLVRLCIKLLQRAFGDDDVPSQKLETYWMVIAAVTKVWGQADLWEDAVSTLRDMM